MAVTVDFSETEIQRDLRALVSSVVNDQVSGDTVRSVMLASGVDEGLTTQLIDSGVHALMIDEPCCGAGATLAEAVIVAEVLATRVAPTPYLSSAIITPAFLSRCADTDSRNRLLARMAAGTTRVTLAYRDALGHSEKPSGVLAARTADGVVLNGVSGHVLDGVGADELVVIAQNDGHAVAVVVARDTPGVSVTASSVLDLTRPLAQVTFTDVVLPADAVLHGDVAQALAYALRAALVALSHEAVGGLTALLTLTTAYAKQRVQFGRAIGSFQAVKHRLVDVLIAKEAAKSAAVYAAKVFDDNDTEAAIAAYTAAAYCLPAYVTAAANCLQIFGGIGFTWEHDMHLHLKRAKASSLLFGSAHQHRRMLATVVAL